MDLHLHATLFLGVRGSAPTAGLLGVGGDP